MANNKAGRKADCAAGDNVFSVDIFGDIYKVGHPGIKSWYFIYGTSGEYPYEGGWTEVYARCREEAIRKHDNRFGLMDGGVGRYEACYEEAEFENSEMYAKGYLGVFRHKVLP